jgi:hypothetical protein
VPCLLSLTLDDLIYQYFGVGLAMSLLPAIADFGLVSKCDDLISLGFSQRSSHDLGSLNDRIANKGIAIPPDKEHLIEFDPIAFSDIQTLDFYCLLWGYLVLLAIYFNNSVNIPYLRAENGILAPQIARCQADQEGC